MQGIISSIGRVSSYTDYDVLLNPQTEGVDNWTADSTRGPDAYVQGLPASSISNSLYLDENTNIEIFPRPSNASIGVTQGDLDNFGLINIAETVSPTGQEVEGKIKFFSLTCKPGVPIYLTVRVHKW